MYKCFLDLSRVEAGKWYIEYKPFNLKRLLNEIKEKGLTFFLNLDTLHPELIILDETRLRQILLNLVGNETPVVGV